MGIELDLRSEGNKIILQHDPFKSGESFESLLRKYHHALIILNVKIEGLEEAVIKLLKKYRVKRYFFLDLSFPAMMRLVRQGERNIAVRFSEFEPLEQCLALKEKVRWVWVDCFTKMPLTIKSYTALKKHFKLCLVSPELQHDPKEKIAGFKKQIAKFKIDAVCTKYPELWKK